MDNRQLGRSDLQVSPLTLGTMTFGSQVDEPTARTMVDLFLSRGMNFIDTANVYNAGVAENMLGRILAGRRDRVVLATKVGIKMGDAPDEQGLSPAAINKAIEDSLRRLQTDYVDLYYLHQPDYSTPLEGSLAALDKLVRAGKVRQVAASNYASWQVCRMLWLTEKNNWQPMVAVQPMYNLLARRIEQELLPFCRDQQIAVVPYNPLSGGLLTGKHTAKSPIAGSRFDRMPLYRDRYWNATNFAALERLSQVAQEARRSLTQLAIGWLLQQSSVTSVILGASQPEHLEQNLAVIDLPPLPESALTACDEVWGILGGVSPAYNR
jgi:aryl-alcohol dehydrogenase-like predicted oxidoreductase